MFRPEKAKSWPLIVVWSVFGRAVAALVALAYPWHRTHADEPAVTIYYGNKLFYVPHSRIATLSQ
jgi:hypothetical protein